MVGGERTNYKFHPVIYAFNHRKTKNKRSTLTQYYNFTLKIHLKNLSTEVRHALEFDHKKTTLKSKPKNTTLK